MMERIALCRFERATTSASAFQPQRHLPADPSLNVGYFRAIWRNGRMNFEHRISCQMRRIRNGGIAAHDDGPG